MPRTYLSFPEFKATGRPVDDLRLDIDTGGQVEGDTPVPGIIYADGIGYIFGHGPDYELVISNASWSGTDLERLELVLWATHYLPEGADNVMLHFTDGTLDNYVQGVCAAWGIEVDGDLWGVVFSDARDTVEISLADAHDQMEGYRAMAVKGDAIDKLAREFSRVLRDWLKPEEMEEVRKRNKNSGPDSCASHDFCDANEAMDEAFLTVMKRTFLPDNEDGPTDEDIALWNAAWNVAKDGEFRA